MHLTAVSSSFKLQVCFLYCRLVSQKSHPPDTLAAVSMQEVRFIQSKIWTAVSLIGMEAFYFFSFSSVEVPLFSISSVNIRKHGMVHPFCCFRLWLVWCDSGADRASGSFLILAAFRQWLWWCSSESQITWWGEVGYFQDTFILLKLKKKRIESSYLKKKVIKSYWSLPIISHSILIPFC